MEALRLDKSGDQELSDSTIIKRILSGEKELYEILLRRNNQKLYRVIRSYIKDAAEIEDIMQNVYLKAYEKLDQFKHTSTYATWLIRIGINEALARIKERNKINHLNSQMSFDNVRVLELPDMDQLTPEKSIIRSEARHLLESTIDSLEAKYRAVYILREVEEMTIKEISACLDISASNVKVRFHRAKSLLKEKLYERAIHKDLFEFGFSRCDRITNKVMRQIL